jgi:cytochrome c-type biogenesis protein
METEQPITKLENETQETKPPLTNQRLLIFFHALAFVLGFSLIFIVGWGGAATLFGRLFGSYKAILGKIGGLVIIVFGLSTLGVLKIPWLNYDIRPEWSRKNRQGFIASGLMGVFFAAGWTPCIGTTLGAILTLGFSAQTNSQAMVLASGYAIGLGIPFLLIGMGMNQTTAFVRRFQQYLGKVQIASGVLLLVIGAMLLTNQLTLIAIWAQRNGLFLDLPLGAGVAPTYLIAILAGLISFLSPCVLPLVPAYIGYLSGHAFTSKT